MIYRKKETIEFEKKGVKMRIYDIKKQCADLSILYQETQKGHFEEFYHSKSTFIYYIIEGSGTWFIEGKPYQVQAGDLVLVLPNEKFYYRGNLKQICITSPAWEPEYEHHIRDIEQ